MESNRSYDALLLENQLCFPLYAAAKEVVRLYTPYLQPLNLTYTQYITMMVLWEKKSIVVKELGEALYLDTGTLTPLLKKLKEKGFIRLDPLKEDRRSIVAQVTEAGMALRDQAKDIPVRVGSCVGLEAEEAGHLYQLTHRLLEKLRGGVCDAEQG